MSGVKVNSRILFAIPIVLQAYAGSLLLAAELHSDFPSHIDSEGRYVIYSHGRIVEGDDPRPVHERWGVYDFPAIVSKLGEDGTFTLIAHHRSENTNASNYVGRLKSWVNTLIEAGVMPERITLVGFSSGGHFTALAASQLKPLQINTALLATCWTTGVQEQPSITLSGRLLSIYETTDSALSCNKLAVRSPDLSSFEEVEITTGKEHGAFYTPRPEWIDPLLLWIHQEPSQQPVK